MRATLLKTAGFVPVKYRESLQMVVQEAMASWKDFSNLPSEEKKKLSLGDRLKDVGYVRRDDKGRATYDDKEFFHASMSMPGELRDIAAGIPDTRATAFLDATEALVKETTPIVREFARAVESEFNLRGFEGEVMAARENWVFRYIHYFPSETGANIAHAHADRGGFTLHMNESHPGGQFLSLDGKWRPFPINETETMIFPSMMLQLRSGSKLKALCHRVVATPEAAREGRYSMVAFINFRSSHRFDDANHRLQDMEPGFNYDMPAREFEQLFVPRQQ